MASSGLWFFWILAHREIWGWQEGSVTLYNCIYMIQCKKENFGEKYIGQTGRIIKYRIADHRGYITNQVLATGAHLHLPGHSLADMRYTILEQVRYNNESYRRERETYHINKFNSFYMGINREQ